MAQEYSDPKRAADPFALPNVEAFHHPSDNDLNWMCEESEDWEGRAPDPFAPGYYWWPCFPGCLPDGGPIGPFRTYEEALEDAREGACDEDV